MTATEKYYQDKSKQIHDLIYSDGFRLVHDETCALRTNEVSEEWYCDCELVEVLQLVGKK